MSGPRLTSSLSSSSRLSRRTTLKISGLGVAAAVGLQGLPAAAIQQDELSEPLATFVTGWEAMDADQITDTYAEDGIREDITTGIAEQGREAIRSYLVAFFDAFSDASAEFPIAFGTEEYAAASWVFTGNYTGVVPGYPPGTGQPVMIQGLTLVEIADNHIQRTVDYYDAYGVLIQLGIVPPPETGATPEATPPG